MAALIGRDIDDVNALLDDFVMMTFVGVTTDAGRARLGAMIASEDSRG